MPESLLNVSGYNADRPLIEAKIEDATRDLLYWLQIANKHHLDVEISLCETEITSNKSYMHFITPPTYKYRKR